MELDDDLPLRRAGPREVTTVKELKTLDEAAMLRGYRSGLAKEPGYNERDRAYWHGFLNGMVDGGHAQVSEAQAKLARAVVSSGYLRELSSKPRT